MRISRIAAVATATLLAAGVIAPGSVGAAPSSAAPDEAATTADGRNYSDNLLRPWQEKEAALRQAALEQKVRGQASGDVVRLGAGRFADTRVAGTDRIFVVLAEFGRTEHPSYLDGDSDATRFNGPRHNQIPKPDRSKDNRTLWQRDYDREHYEDMYFNRMKSFYEDQSMGAYSVSGDVTEWVKVPFNEARYGRDYCGSIVCNNTWFLVRDALSYWVDGQLADGRTMLQIRRYLKTFDHQDRYDYDEDGDFAEPDGYIDHFQIVHAGGDQADSEPVYGSDAIWSHRSYAQIQPPGTGPAQGPDKGGVNVGEGGVSGDNVQIPDHPTGVWVGDYTIQPENGGLGVFAHEFGHDLGLPDLYDTSGNTGGAENNTAFWSLMSQSRGTAVGDPGVGDKAMPMAAWEKFQLGWLNYDVVRTGRTSEHTLRPSQTDGKKKNGLIVLLPNKHVQLELGDPCDECGEQYFYSGNGNDYEATMTNELEAGGELTAKVRYEIEPGFDYAFLESTNDGGETWDPVETNVSYEGEDEGGADPTDTGISGSSEGQWLDLSATIPANADGVRFRYLTDPAVSELGFQVDEIAVDGDVIGGAEMPEGWDFDGFRVTTGSEDQEFLNAYVVENRQFLGRDRLLAHVYNAGWANTNPNREEFHRYTPGMLVNYWDTSYTDNNVGDHPGHGEVLPVDAHPTFTHTDDGSLVRNRVLTYDSTFGIDPTERLRLHSNGAPYIVPSQAGRRIFDDTRDWWYAFDEHGSNHPGRYQPGWYSVDVPKTGTKIRVMSIDKNRVMSVKVSPVD